MFFPFTFSTSTPANPFANSADPGQVDYASPTRIRGRPPPPKTSCTEEPAAGLSRKRGRWSPELKARACSPTTSLASTSAYIDPPGQYVDLGDEPRDQDTNNELRPPKRRRIVEITDSLISTAFSAAVVGTAVGLTAYRLWRDRGKEGSPTAQPVESFSPPPPYTERPELAQPPAGPSYVPGGPASVTAPAIGPSSIPRRPSARPSTTGRRTQMHSSRRRRPVSTAFQHNPSPAASFHRDRSVVSHHTAPSSSRGTPGPSSSSHQPNTSIQSGDELDDDEMEMSGQMDWMSSRLQDLINQGTRALGAEVVVGGADADDGADGWDDDVPAVNFQAHSSTSSGATRTATRTPALGRPSSRASGASRRRGPRVSSGSVSSMRKPDEEDLGFEVLYQSPMRSVPVTKTMPNDGTSEELRVAMERVRKAYGLK